MAILAVIVLPITSGDTAFRSTRLILAEVFKTSQKKVNSRLMIAVPLFVVGIVISQVDFQVVWRYFGWSNQTLATLVLWSAAVWLLQRGKAHWIASIPATFMTSVVVTYLFNAKIGFGLEMKTAGIIGIATAVVVFFGMLFMVKPKSDADDDDATATAEEAA